MCQKVELLIKKNIPKVEDELLVLLLTASDAAWLVVTSSKWGLVSELLFLLFSSAKLLLFFSEIDAPSTADDKIVKTMPATMMIVERRKRRVICGWQVLVDIKAENFIFVYFLKQSKDGWKTLQYSKPQSQEHKSDKLANLPAICSSLHWRGHNKRGAKDWRKKLGKQHKKWHTSTLAHTVHLLDKWANEKDQTSAGINFRGGRGYDCGRRRTKEQNECGRESAKKKRKK